MSLFREVDSVVLNSTDCLPRACAVKPSRAVVIFDFTSIANLDSVIGHFQIEFPQARCIALFDSEDGDARLQAMMVKAKYGRPHGFIPLNAEPRTCEAVLCIVSDGGEILPWTQCQEHQLTNLVRSASHQSDLPPEDSPSISAVTGDQDNGLTERERQVLRLLTTGMQNKVMANRLGISENTVRIHIHHILRKLGVRNRTEAANAVIRSGLVVCLLYVGLLAHAALMRFSSAA